MIPDPSNPDLLKTATKVFRYDKVLTTWGWIHDVYYDRKANVFYIIDFPQDGSMFELSECPRVGPATIEAKGKMYDLKVYQV